MRNPDDNRALIQRIVSDAADGRLRPAIPTVAKLEEVVDVLRDFENRRVTGRVVLVP
jgi:NADPH:quinone reductase-like Zn-dependent oxidoreductase